MPARLRQIPAETIGHTYITSTRDIDVAVDPVCGMEVDPAKARYKTLYRGKVYYFCSSMCKEEFEKRPEYYLQHGPQGMPHR